MVTQRTDGTVVGSARDFIVKNRKSKNGGRRKAKRKAAQTHLNHETKTIELMWEGELGHIGRTGGGSFHCKSCDAGLHFVPIPPEYTAPDIPRHCLYCVHCQSLVPFAESGKVIEEMIDVMLRMLEEVAPAPPEPEQKPEVVDTGIVSVDGRPIRRKAH